MEGLTTAVKQIETVAAETKAVQRQVKEQGKVIAEINNRLKGRAEESGVQEALRTAKEMIETLEKMADPQEAGETVGFFRIVKIKDEGWRKVQWRTQWAPLDRFMQWYVFEQCRAKRKRGSAPRGNLERLIKRALEPRRRK